MSLTLAATSLAAPTVMLAVADCEPGTKRVQVNVLTDYFPEETSWTLFNECTQANEKTYAADVTPYPSYIGTNTQYSHQWCVPEGQYTFTINDTAGDGICCVGFNCVGPRGDYSVVYGQEEVASGADFGSSESTTFGTCDFPEAPAPVATCKDVYLNADEVCQATVSSSSDFDGGSSVLGEANLSFSVSPAGPYSLGDTSVTLTVSADDRLSEGTCEATVTVQDTTAPEVLCSEVVPTKIGETFHAVSISTDNCDSSLTTTNECGEDVVDNKFNFATAGVYTCTSTVRDGAGNKASCTVVIPVYDPAAGFVTGGGQIDSPAAAFKGDQSLTGRAAFGFSSKYEGKGAKIPTGDTSFVFKTGGLSFASTEYDWLVVTGGNYAKFKGEGTIDDEVGVYKFQVWAGDGGKSDDDTFRIKIWKEDTVVYDNGMDQAIARGQIKVHSPKKKVRALRGP